MGARNGRFEHGGINGGDYGVIGQFRARWREIIEFRDGLAFGVMTNRGTCDGVSLLLRTERQVSIFQI